MRRTAARAQREFIQAGAFPKLGARALGKELERRNAARHVAADVIFAAAASGYERFSEIVARLGAAHPVVQAHKAASELEAEVLAECRRRYGAAVTFDSQWPTFLATRR